MKAISDGKYSKDKQKSKNLMPNFDPHRKFTQNKQKTNHLKNIFSLFPPYIFS